MATYSTLTLRILSSAILIPIVLAVIALGGWTFAGFMAICIGIALSEWVYLSTQSTKVIMWRILLIALGIIYLGSAYLQITYLRVSMPHGFLLTMGLLLTVWASDTGAYMFGKNLGGPKMTPTISPNKTWSGLAGSIICAALVLATWSYLFISDKSIPLSLGFGAGIGLIGQSGDLLMSYFKRRANVKDTGHLIPGHGGILDRIDALLLILPAYLAYATFLLALL